MKTEELNKWLALVANVGVIAGIVFLAYEIRLSNQIAVATTEIALRESYGSGNETVYGNPAIAEVLFKVRDANAELSGTEREMAEYDAIESAYDQGMTTRVSLEAMLADMRWTYINYPALRYVFRLQYDTYTSRHESEVYRAMFELLEGE